MIRNKYHPMVVASITSATSSHPPNDTKSDLMALFQVIAILWNGIVQPSDVGSLIETPIRFENIVYVEFYDV
jgi:hypothetical protein